MAIRITSTKNPKILEILQLNKSHNRREAGLFPIEGLREIKKAFNAGYTFESVFFCPEIINAGVYEILNILPPSLPRYEVSRHVFERTAYRDNIDGILVLAVPEYKSLKDYIPEGNPFLLVLETVEKPGNLGAILRTADAGGVSAVLVCDQQTDIYNPNVVRSSLGCVFTNKVINCTSGEAIQFLKANSIRIYSSSLKAETIYTAVNYRDPAAIVLGSETEGLTNIWHTNADALIKIPMAGEADSLNVSVSAGVIVFEVVRQRGEANRRTGMTDK